MPDLLCLYLDDSGARHPDHAPVENQFRDWFGLGGVLLREKDEVVARALHKEFCEKWKIDYPLRSFDIRQRTRRFSWLGMLADEKRNQFMDDLAKLMTSIPTHGHACVIDRPGYDARYRDKHAGHRWLLCKTAFTVLVERAAKIARKQGCRLRIYPETGDPNADAVVESYYDDCCKPACPSSMTRPPSTPRYP